MAFTACDLNSSKSMSRMNLRNKFGYGVGHVLNDMVAAMWFSYLLVFLHKVLGLDTSLCGIVILVGQIADGVATPLVGLESDYWASRPLANPVKARKWWHLGGSVCVAATFPFLFMKCIACSDNVNPLSFLVFYIPFVVIFQFGWAATQVSHLSLIPELSDTHSESVQLNSIRYAATVCSNLIVYGVAWVVLGMNNPAAPGTDHRPNMRFDSASPHFMNLTDAIRRKSLSDDDRDDDDNSPVTPNDAPRFKTITGVVEILGVTFTILFHLLTKHSAYHHRYFQSDSSTRTEVIASSAVTTTASTTNGHSASENVRDENNGVPNLQGAHPPAKRAARLARLTWYLWLKRFDFYLVGLIYMCTRLYINITSVYLPLYALESLGLGATSIAYAPLAVYTASLVVSVVIKPLLDRVGNRISLTFGCIVALGACIVIFLLSKTLLTKHTGAIAFPLVMLSFLIGTASAALFVTALLLISELIGEQKSSSAFVFGAMSLTDKISNGVVIAVIQTYHPCAKNSLACLDFYIYIMTFVPGISIALVLIADLALLFFRRRVADVANSSNSDLRHHSPVAGHVPLDGLADDGASVVHGHPALPIEERHNSTLMASSSNVIERTPKQNIHRAACRSVYGTFDVSHSHKNWWARIAEMYLDADLAYIPHCDMRM